MQEYVMDLPNFLSKFTRNTLIILSPSTRDKIKKVYEEDLFRKFYLVSTHDVTYDHYLGVIGSPEIYDYTAVLGIGGGTAIDFAKFLGTICKKATVSVVPSMLSTNAFATNKVAAINNGVKHTITGVQPDVCIDRKLLEQSTEENLWGIVDTLSIFTALKDWDLAHKNIGLEITKEYQRAQDLLNAITTKNYKNKVTIEWLYRSIQESGYITNDYGSGRPESGSEHIFASALETKIPIPHALAVSIGIVVMSYYMGISVEDVKKLPFKDLGVINEINNRALPMSLVYEVIGDMKPRADKYTYVDLGLPLEQANKNDIKNYLNQIGFKFS